MIINTVYARQEAGDGGHNNTGITLSSPTTLQFLSTGDTALLEVLYNNIHEIDAGVSFFSGEEIFNTQLVRWSDPHISIDVTDKLLDKGYYPFKTVVSDVLLNCSRLEMGIVYNYQNTHLLTKTFSADKEGFIVTGADLSGLNNVHIDIPPYFEHEGLIYPVIEIGIGAFEDNDLLEQITIPETIKKIGSRAFFSTGALKRVEIYSDQPPTLGNDEVFDPFTEGAEQVFIYVKSRENYLLEPFWDEYTSVIRELII